MPDFYVCKNCPLINNLACGFREYNVENYDPFIMFDNLKKSEYNTCFKQHNVPLYYHTRRQIFETLCKGAKSTEYKGSFYAPIFAYAWVCYVYELSFSELDELLPIAENLDLTYANKHFVEIDCTKHIEQLYKQKVGINQHDKVDAPEHEA